MNTFLNWMLINFPVWKMREVRNWIYMSLTWSFSICLLHFRRQLLQLKTRGSQMHPSQCYVGIAYCFCLSYSLTYIWTLCENLAHVLLLWSCTTKTSQLSTQHQFTFMTFVFKHIVTSTFVFTFLLVSTDLKVILLIFTFKI